MRLRRLSPSTARLFAGEACNVVEFAARSVDSVAPEKNACML